LVIISFLAAALPLLSLATFAGKAYAQNEINFGIISTESSQNLRVVWEPFLADMEKATGLKINAYFATDYAGIIEAMRFNKAQLAWYGNKAAMEAVDRADGEVFAQTISLDGTLGYYSHMIVNSDSPVNDLDGLWKEASALSFSNGDPNSTSGFLVPGYYVFALNGKDPKTTFKRTINGSHEANALAVAGKQVDVATVSSEGLMRLERTAPDRRKNIKIIWTSPLIASDPLVWRKDLSPDLKKKIEDFIFNYGKNDAEKTVLKNLLWTGFRKSDNSQLTPFRKMELYKEKKTLEDSGKLSADDAKRIAEIDAKLAALE
jgi:phosphonate transport system substrate-binding protein